MHANVNSSIFSIYITKNGIKKYAYLCYAYYIRYAYLMLYIYIGTDDIVYAID